MPHLRKRFALLKIEKKLNYSPVVAIQGARQTGKSFFVREILSARHPHSVYLTFDKSQVLASAKYNLDSFLIKYSDSKPIMIDEAQKLPELFDEVKAVVDERRVPGAFVLLGSTEFSKMTRIRESLTGRISRMRFFPFTMAEALELSWSEPTAPFFLSQKKRISPAHILKHLERGGLPAIFSIRSEEERDSAFQDWLALTLHRDLHAIPGLKLDSELAGGILKKVATLAIPSAGGIAKALKVDLRKVKTHLLALKTLFVIEEIRPHEIGSGMPIYFIMDVGVANRLGADFERQVQTLFIQEYLAKRSFSKIENASRITYYRAARSERVLFCESRASDPRQIKHHFAQIHLKTSFKAIDFYALEALSKKIKEEELGERMVITGHEAMTVPAGLRCVDWTLMG